MCIKIEVRDYCAVNFDDEHLVILGGLDYYGDEEPRLEAKG